LRPALWADVTTTPSFVIDLTLFFSASATLTLKVTVVVPRSAARSLDARGPPGTLTVRFAGVRLNYCATPLSITARGGRSGLVRARIPIRECATP
jgi:hypothetical protein